MSQKILFVCLGNICRSPLAEGIFRKVIADRNLVQFYAPDSCGTGNYHIGQQPDHRTIRNATKNGLTLTHQCRQISKDDLVNFDLILAMDSSNLRNILCLEGASGYRNKIKLMRDFDEAQDDTDVPDPYHGTEKDFQEVFEIVERCVLNLIQQLENERLNPVSN